MILFVSTLITGCSLGVKSTEKRQRRVEESNEEKNVAATAVVQESQPEKNSQVELFKGDQIPAFILENEKLEEFDSKELEGQKAIINFFVSWNEDALTRIEDIRKEAKDSDAKVVLINLTELENAEIKDIAACFDGQDMTVLFDMKGKVSKMYDICAIPTTFLVDKNGIIVDILGTDVSAQEERSKLRDFLQN